MFTDGDIIRYIGGNKYSNLHSDVVYIVEDVIEKSKIKLFGLEKIFDENFFIPYKDKNVMVIPEDNAAYNLPYTFEPGDLVRVSSKNTSLTPGKIYTIFSMVDKRYYVKESRYSVSINCVEPLIAEEDI